MAIVKGTKADDVIAVIEQISEEALQEVKEVTLNLSENMRKIVRRCFTSAIRVVDRFHIQKLACDAMQEIRIGHRWEVIQEETDARQEAKGLKRNISLSPLKMVIHARNYWQEADICFSNRLRNGLNHRKSDRNLI